MTWISPVGQRQRLGHVSRFEHLLEFFLALPQLCFFSPPLPLLLHGFQAVGDIAGDLFEQFLQVWTEKTDFAGIEIQGADGPALKTQRQGGRGQVAALDGLFAPGIHFFIAADIVADHQPVLAHGRAGRTAARRNIVDRDIDFVQVAGIMAGMEGRRTIRLSASTSPIQARRKSRT